MATHKPHWALGRLKTNLNSVKSFMYVTSRQQARLNKRMHLHWSFDLLLPHANN